MCEEISIFNNWAQVLTGAIKNAKQSIDIITFSMTPPRAASANDFTELWDSMVQASARGLVIVIHMPKPTRSHPATLGNLGAAQVAFKSGIETCFLSPVKMVHSKCAIIDRELIFIGSGNWTTAAATRNHETYCSFASKSSAEKMLADWRTLKI